MAADAAEDARRAAVAARAVRYLTRTGNADLLPVLGLDAAVEVNVRRCQNPDCGEAILAVRARAKFCRPACATAAYRKPRKKTVSTAT